MLHFYLISETITYFHYWPIKYKNSNLYLLSRTDEITRMKEFIDH